MNFLDMLSPVERIACVTIYVVTALIGYVTSIYVIVYAVLLSKRRSSFVTICVFKCILNTLVLTVFTFWIAPLTITFFSSSSLLFFEIVNRLSFAIIAAVYEAQLYVSLLLAVNRFVAIMFWNYYERLFKTTIIYVGQLDSDKLVIQIALAAITVYKTWHCYQVFSMRIIYRGDEMTWELLEMPPDDGVVYDVYILIGIATLLNLVTLLYVVFNAVVRKSHSISPSKRVKENSILFLQAFFQDLIFPVDITFMFILSRYWENGIFQFVCNNYTSLLVHAVDGPIMLVFQRHMLRPLKRLMGIKEIGHGSSWARSTVQTSRHQ